MPVRESLLELLLPVQGLGLGLEVAHVGGRHVPLELEVAHRLLEADPRPVAGSRLARLALVLKAHDDGEIGCQGGEVRRVARLLLRPGLERVGNLVREGRQV